MLWAKRLPKSCPSAPPSSRKDAGLTQVEVARRLGRTQSFVTKAERGERRLDVVELRAFARIYRKPVSFFFGSANAIGPGS